MLKEKLLKLAKMLVNFATVEVGEERWVYEGDFVVGTEVFIEVDGEMKPVADGEYIKDDTKIEVEGGKIESIETIEEQLEEEAPEEPQPDEKDLRIQELEGLLQDRDTIIEELTAKVKELEEQINKPVEEPVKMSATIKDKEGYAGALKYFKK